MTFKILSLDGGGMRGAISARILQEVERQIKELKGLALHEYFDMVAGTSTGSLLTAGIAAKKNTQELIKLYQDYGHIIFPREESFWPNPIQQMIQAFSPPKYSHDGLIKSLKATLGEVKIREVESPIILIPAYDTLYRNTTFFTNCHPDLGERWYDDTPLWEICVCSSSAPTFFPPYELKPYNKEKFGDWSFPHIDGGVSANNPSLAAISLALRVSNASNVSPDIKQKYHLENLKLEDISVLSIGTGRTGEPYQYSQVKEWKNFDWIKHVIDVFMEPTSEIDTTICKQILGEFGAKRYLRLQFDLNERFGSKANETYKDTRQVLPPEQRTNRFTGKKLTEEIDDATDRAINDMLDTATSFIEKGRTYYTRNEDGPLVKDAIAQFIDYN